jgi:hypothetical protein
MGTGAMATAADLMTATVPQAREDNTVADAMELLQSLTWSKSVSGNRYAGPVNVG